MHDPVLESFHAPLQGTLRSHLPPSIRIVTGQQQQQQQQRNVRGCMRIAFTKAALPCMKAHCPQSYKSNLCHVTALLTPKPSQSLARIYDSQHWLAASQ